MDKKNITYKFNWLQFGLILLFIGYYSSNTMFYHAHNCKGKTITHSHPFKTNSKSQHTHNSFTFQLINKLNKISFDNNLFNINIAPGVTFLTVQLLISYTNNSKFAPVTCKLLRAPPLAIL